MELKKYKLGEICKIFGRIGFRGYTTKDLVETPYEGAISLSPSNIVDGTMDLSKCTYISWVKYEESPEIKINPNDILIVKTGNSYGRSAIIRNIGHPMTINPQFVVLKNIKINPVYLAYYIRTNEFQKQIHGIVGGSAIPTLSQENLANLIVRVPNEVTQSAIGKVLADIDRKIELNKRINDNLEAMAKQLYDYWFVQFDFPDGEGKPYKASGGKMVWNEKLKREIPEGWDVSNVKSLIEPIERGVSYSSDEILDMSATPMINLACFSKAGDYRLGEMKFFSGNIPEAKLISPMDMLIACTDMTQGADIIGRPILASNEFEKYTFSTDLALVIPKGKFKMYLYYTLRTPFYHKYIRPFASGTTVKHLNLIGVENYVLPIPPMGIQSMFENTVAPIKEQQSKNLNEIVTLTKQRDELLPLLMNGQASVTLA